MAIEAGFRFVQKFEGIYGLQCLYRQPPLWIFLDKPLPHIHSLLGVGLNGIEHIFTRVQGFLDDDPAESLSFLDCRG